MFWSSLLSVVQQMTVGMSIALGGLALAPLIRGTGDATARASDFQVACWMMAGLALLALVDAVRLPADAGQSMPTRPAG